MEGKEEQIYNLEKAIGVLRGERRAVVNRLRESSDFLSDVSIVEDHQAKIEALLRAIADEKSIRD